MECHPTAIISPGAEIGKDVEIGPYCVIGEGVRIGAKSRLISHVVISGDAVLGEGCVVYPFASIGLAPQDIKYEGEASRVIIGARAVIRENVTIHRGTQGGNMETRIGTDCLLMACAHVAHDCVVGDHVILANAVLLGGHCNVDHHAFLGGATLCQQFIHIGAHAFISGGSGVTGHVPPFAAVFGYPAMLTGINVIGLKRNGFSRSDMHDMRKAYKVYYETEGVSSRKSDQIAKTISGQHVSSIVDFIKKREGERCGLIKARWSEGN